MPLRQAWLEFHRPHRIVQFFAVTNVQSSSPAIAVSAVEKIATDPDVVED